MSSSNLIRLSGLAAVLGGVLFLAAELLSFATETEDFRRSEWANTTPYLFTWSLFLLSGVLLQIGLVGLYRARVYPRAVAIVLIVGAFLTNLPVPFTGIVLDAAVALLGFILFTRRGETAPQSSRVS